MASGATAGSVPAVTRRQGWLVRNDLNMTGPAAPKAPPATISVRR